MSESDVLSLIDFILTSRSMYLLKTFKTIILHSTVLLLIKSLAFFK